MFQTATSLFVYDTNSKLTPDDIDVIHKMKKEQINGMIFLDVSNNSILSEVCYFNKFWEAIKRLKFLRAIKINKWGIKDPVMVRKLFKSMRGLYHLQAVYFDQCDDEEEYREFIKKCRNALVEEIRENVSITYLELKENQKNLDIQEIAVELEINMANQFIK